jgi:ribonuclease Y
MVGKVKSEVDTEILKAGQEAVDRLGLAKVKPNLVRLLGRLKYRYSYSQNVLQHSLEVAYMMGGIAAQLGLDESRARRAGLFHDIGKAVDHEVEGSHAVIGADLLKRAGEDDEICNSVGAHHEEMEKTTLLGVLVALCDALSASRPGARSETTELYLKRLEELESVGKAFDGVDTCYAIQAGRELRVIVQPEKIDENRAMVLAREMADRIEKEMRYPGQIRVTVIRETRAVEYAK